MSLFFDLFRKDPDVRYLEEGEFLFHEGDPDAEEMYVMLSGSAHVLVGGRLLEEACTGTILGEMALVESGEPRNASVLAMSRCGFIAIDEQRFHFLISEAPHFAHEVMRVLTQRLRRTNQTLTSLMPSPACA